MLTTKLLLVFTNLAIISAEVIFSSFLTNLPPASVHDAIITIRHPDYDNIVSETPVATNDVERNDFIEKLQKAAASSQSPIHEVMDASGFTKEGEGRTSHWISNAIVVEKADVTLLQTILTKVPKFTGSRIEVNEPTIVTISPFIPSENYRTNRTSDSLNDSMIDQVRADPAQWGVKKIEADQVWNTGNKGQGIVVGIIDTGVNVNHVALKNNYAGSFMDAYSSRTDAYDGHGHGTHCAGTILGQTNGIGVAPEATWIACRGLDNRAAGSTSKLLTCGAFMACPKKDASNKCTGFPHIVNNSWGGGQNNKFFNDVIANWHKLSITPVFAIGNRGNKCNTADSPGDQPNLISVGATDTNDRLAGFSSRGPQVLKPTSDPPKPELSAPGVNILSANFQNVNGYKVDSGTSMATPHVSGTIALMKNKNRNLTFKQIQNILDSTVEKPAVVQDSTYCVKLVNCGQNNCPLQYSNNGYGFGLLNALKAVNKVPRT